MPRKPMRSALPYHLALLLPLLLLVLVLVAREGEARPGGGNTYRGSSSSRSSSSGSSSSRGSSSGSSSSRSYSSSSASSRGYSGSSSSTRSSFANTSSPSSYSDSASGDDGGITGGFFSLLFFALFLGVVVIAVNHAKKHAGDWSTTAPSQENAVSPAEPAAEARKQLSRLRTVGPPGQSGRPVPFDPDFSLVLFEDFLYALYAKAHEARGGDRLDTLAAYLSQSARRKLRGISQPAQVKAVVVGAMQYLAASKVRPDSTTVTVCIRFEANSTEVSESGSEQSHYVAEEWTLSRSTAVKSRPPDQARVFQCPSCGAPLEDMQDSTCSYCEQKVDTGEFDWVVDTVVPLEREARGPQLGGDPPEQGTELPTVKQLKVEERLHRLLEQAPELSWEGLDQRLGLIFQELQVAWSKLQWERARPYVSDSLFQMQLYWMKAYKQAGLRNVTENARITELELARLVSDKYFHAITVRVHATGLDYTLRDSDGRVVGGSRTRERQYTEYWTLIRGTGATGKPRGDKRCPSCGGPLVINMAGTCTHCSAHVTSGEFDWVLSRIEQDESYTG